MWSRLTAVAVAGVWGAGDYSLYGPSRPSTTVRHLQFHCEDFFSADVCSSCPCDCNDQSWVTDTNDCQIALPVHRECMETFIQCASNAINNATLFNNITVEATQYTSFIHSGRPCQNKVMDIESGEFWVNVIDELNGYSIEIEPTELMYVGDKAQKQFTLVLSEPPYSLEGMSNDSVYEVPVGVKYRFESINEKERSKYRRRQAAKIWDTNNRSNADASCFEMIPPTMPLNCKYSVNNDYARHTLECNWSHLFDDIEFLVPNELLVLHISVNVPHTITQEEDNSTEDLGQRVPLVLPPVHHIELITEHNVIWHPSTSVGNTGTLDFPVCGHPHGNAYIAAMQADPRVAAAIFGRRWTRVTTEAQCLEEQQGTLIDEEEFRAIFNCDDASLKSKQCGCHNNERWIRNKPRTNRLIGPSLDC